MKRIHNYIKDYHWLGQVLIWGTVWFILSTALTAVMYLFIELSKIFQ